MINRRTITADRIYNPLTSAEATERMNDLLELIESFMAVSTLQDEDIEWNDALLMKIVVRIDQRSDYFTYFHSIVADDGTINVDEMSQYKQMALLCFWIIKYKPLRIKDKRLDLGYFAYNHCSINETFAAYLFVSQVFTSKTLSKTQRRYYKSNSYLKDLFYKFMHHDISKEAMIFSLCSLVCCK